MLVTFVAKQFVTYLNVSVYYSIFPNSLSLIQTPTVRQFRRRCDSARHLHFDNLGVDVTARHLQCDNLDVPDSLIFTAFQKLTQHKIRLTTMIHSIYYVKYTDFEQNLKSCCNEILKFQLKLQSELQIQVFYLRNFGRASYWNNFIKHPCNRARCILTQNFF